METETETETRRNRKETAPLPDGKKTRYDFAAERSDASIATRVASRRPSRARGMRRFSSQRFRLKTEMRRITGRRERRGGEKTRAPPPRNGGDSRRRVVIRNVVREHRSANSGIGERTLCFACAARSSSAPMVSLNLSECVNFPTHTPRETSWSRATLVARFMISSRT